RFEQPDGCGIGYIEAIEAATRQQLQLVEQNVATRPQLAIKLVMAAKLARERIAPAIGEFGKGNDDESEAAKAWQNAFYILPWLNIKPKRDVSVPGRGAEILPLGQVDDHHA